MLNIRARENHLDVSTLATWYAALANRANAPAKILWFGDSQLEGTGATVKANRAIDRVMAMLDAAYPTSGATWGEFLPQHWAMPQTGGGSTGLTTTPWGGDWFTASSGTHTESDTTFGPGLRSTSLAVGASLTYPITGSAVDVWYAPGGTLAVSVDGGAATNINTASANTYGSITNVSLGANGAHTVNLTASGSACSFCGFTVYRGATTKGLLSFDANHYGYAVPSEWDSTGSNTALNGAFSRMLALANPHLVMVNLFANDVFGTENQVQYQTNLTSMIGAIKAAVPGVSIAAFPSYAQDYPGKVMPNGGSWTSYADVLRYVASFEAAFGFFMTPPMPSTNLPGGGANTATGDYWADRQHMTDLGDSHYADWCVSRIAPLLRSFVRITQTPSTAATVGAAYSDTVSAANRGNGSGAITYSVDTLPAGLSLNASTGAITGTPTTAQTLTSTFTASNGTQSASTAVNYVVSAASSGITYIGYYSIFRVSTGTISVTLPAGSAANDCAVILTSQDTTSNAYTMPTGAMAIFSGYFGADGQQYQDALYFLTATDVTNGHINLTDNNGNDSTIIVLFFRGVNTTSPLNASLATTSDSNVPSPVSLTANSITTTVANCMLVYHGFPDTVQNNTSSFGAYPGSWTKVVDELGTWADSTAGYLLQASAGATGTVTVVYTSPSASNESVGCGLIALAPQ